LENILRANVFARRLRIEDLFCDFDKLRSGFVSRYQFRQAISAIMEKGIHSPLNDEDYDILMNHYDVKKDGRVKWTAFVDSINKGNMSFG
jgi:Ca2+-binding EF-hand superfamily protein